MLDFIKYNDEIIRSIQTFNISFPSDINLKKILAEFLLLDSMQDCFGDFGEKFRNFILNTDMEHPELFTFLSNVLGDAGISEIHEIIEIKKFCKRKKFKTVAKNLKSMCNNFSWQKMYTFGKNIEYLEQSKIHSRFLSQNRRWEVRASKKICKINGNKNVELIESESQNNEIFLCYHHNSDKIQKVLEDLKQKHQTLCQMNCAYMASEVKNSINKITLDLNLQSLGFHRITLNSVAKNLNKICKDSGDIRIHPVTQEMCAGNKVLGEMIELCENFPAFGKGFAAFDHYAVVKYDDAKVGIIVGERDTQAFFIGYYYDV